MDYFCPRCSADLAKSAAECRKCGALFTDPNGWQPLPKGQDGTAVVPVVASQSTSLIGRVIVVILSLLAALLLLFSLLLSVFDGGRSFSLLVILFAVVVVAWRMFAAAAKAASTKGKRGDA